LENLMAAATKPAAAKDTGISKIDAVRKALKELGKDAMPVKIQGYLKEKFGLEMTTSYVSVYKSHLLRKKKRKKAVSKAAMPEGTPATSAPPLKAASASANGSSVSLDDIAAVKGLVGRVGEDKLKSLIELLG
jgi:hypothetical protein